MKAGSSLDILIAERVMGWKLLCYESDVYAKEPGQYDDAMRNDGWLWDGDIISREAHEFNPSIDMAAAMEVVEKVSQNGDVCEFKHINIWTASFRVLDEKAERWIEVYAEADTAPLAICLAALKLPKGK